MLYFNQIEARLQETGLQTKTTVLLILFTEIPCGGIIIREIRVNSPSRHPRQTVKEY